MEQIWWERVPNAWTFISDMVRSLLDEKSIILNCSGGIPWHSHMVQTVKESVGQQNSSKRFEYASPVLDPGSYLLREYCKPEKRAEYRPTKSYARFLAESDDIVLHERYVWIKVSSKKLLDAWTGFVSEYVRERGKNKETAVFILEWGGGGSVQARKGVKLCSFDDYVCEYDRIVFCMLASSSVRDRSFIKNYLAELAANVLGNDIELCAACLEDYEAFLESPFAAVRKIVQSKVRSDGSEYGFDRVESDVNHFIWRAQIKTVYPVLEEYREGFVRKYSAAIAKQLPVTSSYGEIYRDPSDIELGTLKYMADNGQLLLTLKDYERLKVNKEARDKLSHLIPLTLEEIRKLDF